MYTVQFAELRAPERVEAGGAGLGKHEVLPGGRPLVGRDPPVDPIGFAPLRTSGLRGFVGRVDRQSSNVGVAVK